MGIGIIPHFHPVLVSSNLFKMPLPSNWCFSAITSWKYYIFIFVKIKSLFKRIVQTQIYVWYVKEEHILSILWNFHSFPMFGSRDISNWSWHIFYQKWTWSKQVWCHGFTLKGNVLFFFKIYYQFYTTKL